MARVISFVQQKGGCGKTTTTVNVGAYLASMGHQVLLVDLDPQTNLTQSLGIQAEDLKSSILDLLLEPGKSPAEIIQTTSFGGKGRLDLLPSSANLVGLELSKISSYGKEWLLFEALRQARLNYDFILIDPPPSLGLLTVNALMASSEIIIPFQCHAFSP